MQSTGTTKNRRTIKRLKKGIGIAVKRKLETADILAVFGIVIAVVFGIFGYIIGKEQVRLSNVQIKMSEEQGKTSLDIQHFNYLLKKTDSILNKSSEMTVLSNNQIEALVLLNKKLASISLASNEQLRLNRQEQQKVNLNYDYAMIGNMNKLKNAIHQIESLKYSDDFDFSNIVFDEHHLKIFSSKIEEMKVLFVQQMDNPYLNSIDTLQQIWAIAYGDLGETKRQIDLNLYGLGKLIINLNNGKVEKSELDVENLKAYLKAANSRLFLSLGAATGYANNKIRIDKIKRGLLDSKGKYKITAETLYN